MIWSWHDAACSVTQTLSLIAAQQCLRWWGCELLLLQPSSQHKRGWASGPAAAVYGGKRGRNVRKGIIEYPGVVDRVRSLQALSPKQNLRMRMFSFTSSCSVNSMSDKQGVSELCWSSSWKNRSETWEGRNSRNELHTKTHSSDKLDTCCMFSHLMWMLHLYSVQFKTIRGICGQCV